MSKNLITKHVMTFEIIIFVLLIVVLWMNEVFDIPHRMLGAPSTPINWQESIFETCIALALCIVIIIISWSFMKRIKYLEGLLSVCSFCKKIRVGKDWVPIEKYIRDHSEADFSHGLCPGCAEKHYPEYIHKDH